MPPPYPRLRPADARVFPAAMRTRAIQRGDIVLVNKRGRVFHAKVQGLGATGGFAVVPLERNVSYRQAAAREIVDHWAHAGRDRSEDPAEGQISFDELLGD